MLPLIIPALGMAYIARKQYDKAQLNAAKKLFIEKISHESYNLQTSLDDFKTTINCTAEDLNAFQNPYSFLTVPDDLVRFNYALKYNYSSHLLSFYTILLEFQSTLESIQDVAVLEWLNAHVYFYTGMIESMYFNSQEASYVKISNLTKNSHTCDPDKKESLEADIAACKSVIEFVEFCIPYYRSLIIKIAADSSKIEEQDNLHRILGILKSIISRETDCLKDIFKNKNMIKHLEERLATQTIDWQQRNTKSLLARNRSNLALNYLNIYFLQVLKKYFFANQDHPIDLLERYNSAYGAFIDFHDARFTSVFIQGTEILNYNQTTFYIPIKILQEIKACATEFDLPIPDYHEVFIKHNRPDMPPRPKLLRPHMWE